MGLVRVLSNISWMDLFPNTESSFLAPGVSDHCLIYVTMVPPNRRRKPFKFFNFWVEHPAFGQILHNSWSVSIKGWPMFVLSAKLKRLKGVLKQLNLKYYSNFSRSEMDSTAELYRVQEKFASPANEALCCQEKELVSQYMELRSAEEAFKKQRKNGRLWVITLNIYIISFVLTELRIPSLVL